MSSEAGRGLIQRAGRGSLWLLAGRFSHAGLRLVSNIVLAKLLFPEAFGLMGMVSILLMGLELFSDVGVGPSIVRSERGEDRAFLETAWTVQVGRGVLLCGLCWLLAVPYAGFYDEPQLVFLIRLAGLVSLFQGLRSTGLFLADRRLLQGRKVAIGLVAQFAGIATMVAWAWVERSVTSLLVGTIVSTAVYSLLSHLALPRTPLRFRIEREAARELFGFGRWIFFSTALTFLSMQGDRLILQWIVPLVPLGLFFMASGLIELITSVLAQVSSMVVFPTWVASSRLAPEDHVERLRQTRGALVALGMAGLLGIVTLCPALFRLLYDDRYAGVPALVQLLLVPSWFLVLRITASSALLAYGDSRALSSSNLILLLVKIPACVDGFLLFGLPGFILGAGLGSMIGLIPMYAALDEHGCRLRRDDLRATARLAALAAAGVGLPLLAARQQLVPPLLIELPTAAAVGLIAAAPARILTRLAKP